METKTITDSNLQEFKIGAPIKFMKGLYGRYKALEHCKCGYVLSDTERLAVLTVWLDYDDKVSHFVILPAPIVIQCFYQALNFGLFGISASDVDNYKSIYKNQSR